MAVFDGQVKTGLRVSDPGTDKRLPGPGSLSYGSMTSEGAIEGVAGVDCLLTHGDVWREIDGTEQRQTWKNHMANILGQETYTVQQMQTIQITGPVTHTINTDLNFTVLGTHNTVNIGPHNASFVAPQSESRQSPKSMEEPVSRMESRGEKIEWLSGGKFELNYGINAEVNTGMKTEITNLSLEVCSLKGEAEMGHQKSEALSQKMQGLANKVMGVNSEVGARRRTPSPKSTSRLYSFRMEYWGDQCIRSGNRPQANRNARAA